MPRENPEIVSTGRETLAITSSVVTLTDPAVGRTFRAICRLTLAPARWTEDGTAPVLQTTGSVVYSGDVLVVNGKTTIDAFRITRDLPVDAELAVEYQGYDS